MVKIVDNDIWRGTEKIGWIEGNDIYSAAGSRKVGYFTSNDIYDINGNKVGWIEGNFLKTIEGRSIRLEENRARIMGSTASDLTRAAIRLLLGD